MSNQIYTAQDKHTRSTGRNHFPDYRESKRTKNILHYFFQQKDEEPVQSIDKRLQFVKRSNGQFLFESSELEPLYPIPPSLKSDLEEWTNEKQIKLNSASSTFCYSLLNKPCDKNSLNHDEDNDAKEQTSDAKIGSVPTKMSDRLDAENMDHTAKDTTRTNEEENHRDLDDKVRNKTCDSVQRFLETTKIDDLTKKEMTDKYGKSVENSLELKQDNSKQDARGANTKHSSQTKPSILSQNSDRSLSKKSISTICINIDSKDDEKEYHEEKISPQSSEISKQSNKETINSVENEIRNQGNLPLDEKTDAIKKTTTYHSYRQKNDSCDKITDSNMLWSQYCSSLSDFKISLHHKEDINNLPMLDCMIRSELLELFHASPSHIQLSKDLHLYAASESVKVVGIRCKFCKTLLLQNSFAFPTSVVHICGEAWKLAVNHTPFCYKVPKNTMRKWIALMSSHTNSSKMLTSQSAKPKFMSVHHQYWMSSAKKWQLQSFNGVCIFRNDHNWTHQLIRFNDHIYDLDGDLDKIDRVVSDDEENLCHYIMRQYTRCCANQNDLTNDILLGYPGFACIHCAKSSNLPAQRFFPKSLHQLKHNYFFTQFYEHLLMCPNFDNYSKQKLTHYRRKFISEQGAPGIQKKNKVMLLKTLLKVWKKIHLTVSPGTTITIQADGNTQNRK